VCEDANTIPPADAEMGKTCGSLVGKGHGFGIGDAAFTVQPVEERMIGMTPGGLVEKVNQSGKAHTALLYAIDKYLAIKKIIRKTRTGAIEGKIYSFIVFEMISIVIFMQPV
jgi:hypothetical protein